MGVWLNETPITMIEYYTIGVGRTRRQFDLLARLDGDPIESGTVNYYLRSNNGVNAGKWWRDSDQTWQAAETANPMTHVSESTWEIVLSESPFTEQELDFTEWARESGDLHIPNSRNLIVGGPAFILYPTFVTSQNNNNFGPTLVTLYTNDFSEQNMVVYQVSDDGVLSEVDLLSLGEDLVLVFESSDKVDLEVFRTFDGSLTLTGASVGAIAFTPSALLNATENLTAKAAIRIESTGKPLWKGSAKIVYVPDRD